MGQCVICNTCSISNRGWWDTCSDRCFHHQSATSTACRMPLALYYGFDCMNIQTVFCDCILMPYICDRKFMKVHSRSNINKYNPVHHTAVEHYIIRRVAAAQSTLSACVCSSVLANAPLLIL